MKRHFHERDGTTHPMPESFRRMGVTGIVVRTLPKTDCSPHARTTHHTHHTARNTHNEEHLDFDSDSDVGADADVQVDPDAARICTHTRAHAHTRVRTPRTCEMQTDDLLSS